MKVLVVDDMAYSRRSLRSVFLSAGFAVLVAEDGQQALDIARTERPDLIVTDILMPRLDGFQLCRALKADPALARTPVVFYTGSYGEAADAELGMSLGAVAYLVKPLEPRELIDQVMKAIGRPVPQLKARPAETELAHAYADRLAAKLQEKLSELNRLIDTLDETVTGTVVVLGLALAEREGADPIQAERSARLAQLFCERVAPELSADPNVLRGFLLHDLGKLMLPDSVLKKSGPLEAADWEVLKRQPRIAADMLRNVPGLGAAALVVRHVRERWDGTGYPDGLKGEQIPLGARIFAIADAFEAITAGRPWRAKRSVTESVQELRLRAGTQFDPTLIEPFILLVNELQPR